MVRDLLKKVFRKDAGKNESVFSVSDSVTLQPGEYRFVSRPMTATEKTREKIDNYRQSRGLSNI